MKYIRTKDGIYELANERTITEFQVIDHLHNRAFLKSEILAQADTIEELCDGFIMTYTEFRTEYYVYEKLDDIPLLDLKCKNKYFNIYGFIGTDKGLIYVAKLNEKGELELI